MPSTWKLPDFRGMLRCNAAETVPPKHVKLPDRIGVPWILSAHSAQVNAAEVGVLANRVQATPRRKIFIVCKSIDGPVQVWLLKEVSIFRITW